MKSTWMRSSFVLTATGAVAAIVIGVVVNLATGSSLNQWSRTAGVLVGAIGALAVLVSILATFIVERSSNAEDEAELTREQLAFKLIRTFAAIEKDASEYPRPGKEGTSRPLSLREVRNIMANSGVWNYEDQIAFDLATRARNSIVHGDLDEIDPLDLQYAVDKAEQLLKKLRGGEPTEQPMG